MIYVLLASILLPVSGCLVQDAWKNQLGDVYSLSIGTVCCTAAALSPLVGINIRALAAIGCVLCTALYYLVRKLPTQRAITFWLVVGVLVGAIGTIVNNNVSPDKLQEYYRWSSTSFNVNDDFLALTAIFIMVGLLIRDKCIQALLFTSSVIFVVGPVWTISLLAPNLARIFTREYKRNWYLLSMAIGGVMMIVTQFVVWLLNDTVYLPFSATLAILSAPFLVLTYTVKSK